jgi:hypothetical protein
MHTLKGDASSRKYHRVVMKEGFDPATMIVMELPPDALASDEIQAGGAPGELPFLNMARHLKNAGLPVPGILLDAVADGLVLLEDLGDTTLVKNIEGMEEDQIRQWYFAAVDLMARMHETMWPLPAPCVASSRCFDYKLLRWELDHYREWGAEAMLGVVLDPARRGALDAAFDALATEVAALPLGFVHRDYQSRNLMITGPDPCPDSIVIIDFQDALAGPRVYDLVALLNDSYVDLSRETQIAVVERYARTRGIDPLELLREFDLVTVQRKLKDGGRFIFIDRVKGNPSFLPFVDVSFGRVNAALARLPGHGELKSALAAVDPQRFSRI